MKRYQDIILKPLMTEKTYDHIGEKKYVFIVHPDANRTEVKHAVEQAFGVDVEQVNIANRLGKIKRQGIHSGRRPSVKKAYVKLTQDSKPIEFFEGIAH